MPFHPFHLSSLAQPSVRPGARIVVLMFMLWWQFLPDETHPPSCVIHNASGGGFHCTAFVLIIPYRVFSAYKRRRRRRRRRLTFISQCSRRWCSCLLIIRHTGRLVEIEPPPRVPHPWWLWSFMSHHHTVYSAGGESLLSDLCGRFLISHALILSGSWASKQVHATR